MPRLLSILVGVVSLVWAALTIYTEIIDSDPNEYSIKSPEIQQQLANCAGNFQQRQACAERITDARQQLGFLVWCEKVVIILGPPLVLWGLAGLAARQRRGQPAPAPRRTAAGPDSPGPRPRPRDLIGDEPPLRARPEPPSPSPDRGGPAPPAGEPAPIFTGGRREPVRRRDR
jgi:hypothetical protein